MSIQFQCFFNAICKLVRAGCASASAINTSELFNSFFSVHSFNKSADALQVAVTPSHDYTAFYENEIIQRKRLNYPPFCDIIYIMATGENEDEVKTVAEEMGKRFDSLMRKDKNIFSKVGPAPAPIAKIKNSYRYRILLKCKDANAAHGFLREIYEEHEKGRSGVFLTIDINPVSMY